MLAKKVWLLRRRRFTVWSLGLKVELVRVLRGDTVLGFMFLLLAVIAILLHVHAFTLNKPASTLYRLCTVTSCFFPLTRTTRDPSVTTTLTLNPKPQTLNRSLVLPANMGVSENEGYLILGAWSPSFGNSHILGF